MIPQTPSASATARILTALGIIADELAHLDNEADLLTVLDDVVILSTAITVRLASDIGRYMLHAAFKHAAYEVVVYRRRERKRRAS